MLEVKIPKEIREYKEKLFFNLNLRQLISIILGLSIGVPFYIYSNKKISEDISGWGTIIIVFLFGLFGFYQKYGLTFEKYILAMVKLYIRPMRRKYISVSPLEYIADEEYNELYSKVYSGKKESLFSLKLLKKK